MKYELLHISSDSAKAEMFDAERREHREGSDRTRSQSDERSEEAWLRWARNELLHSEPARSADQEATVSRKRPPFE